MSSLPEDLDQVMKDRLTTGLMGVAEGIREFQSNVEAAAEVIGADLDVFGGVLRCNTCGRRETMQAGDSARFLRDGWPTCCGLTMTWWTRRQIKRGEMPDD